MSKILKICNSKVIVSLFAIIFVIFLMVNSVSVYAASVEIAYMTPHYRHPISGIIEDPGQNEEIGQGMTESVLFPQALLETDDNGKMYLTTRNKLAQHISSMKFAVQKKGGKGYTEVPYEVTGQGTDYKDTRFQIPSRSSVIRMEFFVEPMGRTVIFYGLMGKIVPGNTDFKVSVNAGVSNPKGAGNIAANNQNAVSNVNLGAESETVKTDEIPDDDGNVKSTVQNLGEAGKDIGFDHGLLTRQSPEVKRLLGTLSPDKDENIENAPYGEVTKFMLQTLSIVIGILIAVLILTAILLPVYFKILKTKNDRREIKLYAKEDELKKNEGR